MRLKNVSSVVFWNTVYSTSPSDKHSSCKVSEMQMGPHITENCRCKEIRKVACVSTRHCYSCAIVCLQYVQLYRATSEPGMSGSKQKSSSDMDVAAKKCKAITMETKVKIINCIVS